MTIPCKVFCHFPIILWLKIKIYQCKSITQLMQWHAKNSLDDGHMIWSMIDSKAWKQIDVMWPIFSQNPRIFIYFLATNGMNPFGDFNLKHSTWPMLLLMNNLPPCLMTNKFCHVGLHHHGKKSAKDANMETYRHPWLKNY